MMEYSDTYAKIQHDDWQDIFKQFKASGLSQKAFCKAHHIAHTTFKYHYYAKKSDQTQTKPKPVFQAIKVASMSTQPSFIVRLPNGHQCDVPAGFCETDFERLMVILCQY